jgi:hypothetical protein
MAAPGEEIPLDLPGCNLSSVANQARIETI